MTQWKFTDATRKVVERKREDGSTESCLAWREDVLAWVAKGNTIIAPDPVVRTKEELDARAAAAYPKLVALRGMTHDEVQAWVDANVTNIATAKDAIKTLAVAVSILARRIG